MIVDLHSHSTASDGALSPAELIARARQQGVQLMAITDHDSIDAYLQLENSQGADKPQGADELMQLVTGVELSCVWGKQLIHIVGLNIDICHPVIRKGLIQQQQARLQRANIIADKLSRKGFEGSLDFVTELAAGGQIGRPHFARFLVDKGHVKTEKEAFKRYLGAGKMGDVKLTWPPLAEVLVWIKASGGVAVLAHPLYYKMTATKLRALITDFKTSGGDAIEVINGYQPADRSSYLAQLAEQFELFSSIGSDFHRPGKKWAELGRMGRLPKNCRPVWSLFYPNKLAVIAGSSVRAKV